MSSTVETVTSRTGSQRLQRSWTIENPRAAVLLVHGIAEHSGRYEHLGEALNDSGFDVLAFDILGHGSSDGRRGHIDRFDEFLDEVEELMKERRTLGVPVVLMGHSFGGLISATYVIAGRTAPDLLVLSAPALSAELPGWKRALANTMSRIAPKMSIKNDFDGNLLSRDEAVGAAYRDDPLRVRVASTRLGSETFATMAATTDRLSRITIPVYVLHGGEDTLVPPAASEPFTKMVNATRVVHEGLRHECLNEPERDLVIAGIITWIDGRLSDLQPD